MFVKGGGMIGGLTGGWMAHKFGPKKSLLYVQVKSGHFRSISISQVGTILLNCNKNFQFQPVFQKIYFKSIISA
jgi:hypothetical protein